MKSLQYLYYFFVKIIIQNSYLSYKINFLFYNKSFFIHHNNKWSLRLKSEPIWLKEKKSWETLVKDYNLSKIFNHICKGTERGKNGQRTARLIKPRLMGWHNIAHQVNMCAMSRSNFF